LGGAARLGCIMRGIILSAIPCDVTGLAVECAKLAKNPF
jgi:hypothetical protein